MRKVAPIGRSRLCARRYRSHRPTHLGSSLVVRACCGDPRHSTSVEADPKTRLTRPTGVRVKRFWCRRQTRHVGLEMIDLLAFPPPSLLHVEIPNSYESASLCRP